MIRMTITCINRRAKQARRSCNKYGKKLGPGDGNLCRDCHMPGRYYMGIDRRFDHSMRIPRPDLSLKLGTPNACTHCHDNKTDQWAVQNVNKWYGEKKKAHYATLIADGAAGKAGADSGLLRIINSNLYPEIIRATAIGYLSSFGSALAQEALRKALKDPDPLLRYTAVENYTGQDSSELFSYPCSDAQRSGQSRPHGIGQPAFILRKRGIRGNPVHLVPEGTCRV